MPLYRFLCSLIKFVSSQYGLRSILILFNLSISSPSQSEIFTLALNNQNINIDFRLPINGVAASRDNAIFVGVGANNIDDDGATYVQFSFTIYLAGRTDKSCGFTFDITKASLEVSGPKLKRTYELLSEWSDILECNFVYKDSRGVTFDQRYIWNSECGCFIAINASYGDDGAILVRYLERTILAGLRQANEDFFADTEKVQNLIAKRDPRLPTNAVDLGVIRQQLWDAKRRSGRADESYSKNLNDMAALLKERREQYNKAKSQEETAAIKSDTNENNDSADANDTSKLLAKMKELFEMDGKEKLHQNPRSAPSNNPPDDPNTISFVINNAAGRTLHLKFFNKGRSNSSAWGVWPSSNRAYVLNHGQVETYRLGCTKGEHICFGAEFADGARSYWGVSLSGQKGCQGCCGVCGTGQHASRLRHDGSVSPGPSLNSGDGIEALGLALGVVGGVLARQPAQRAPQMLPATPRGPNYRPSGISR